MHTLPLKQLRATHQSLVFFIVIGKHQTMNPNSSKSTYKSYKLLVHSTKPTLPLTSNYGSLFHGDARALNWLGLVRVDSVLQHQVACEFMRWSGEVDAQLLERVDLDGGQRDKLNHTDDQDGLLSVHAHYLEDLKTSNVKDADEGGAG